MQLQHLNFRVQFAAEIPRDFNWNEPRSVTYVVPGRESEYYDVDAFVNQMYTAILDRLLLDRAPTGTMGLLDRLPSSTRMPDSSWHAFHTLTNKMGGSANFASWSLRGDRYLLHVWRQVYIDHLGSSTVFVK